MPYFRSVSVADRLNCMSFDPKENGEELFTSEEVASETADGESADSRVEDADDEQVQEKASPAARKLEPIVLAHVLAPKYQPVKPRVIAKQLMLPSEQHRALKLAIRRLVKSGKLSYGSGHQVRPPKKQESGGRRQESGVRSQESGARSQGTEVRGQRSANRGDAAIRNSQAAILKTCPSRRRSGSCRRSHTA